MFIEIEDGRLFAVSYGTAQRCLVTHGGWAGNWELFALPMELLSPTWRTVAYDHRGTGASLVPLASISFDALVADLFRVMEAYGVQRCVVVGESAGAAVAMQAVLQQPDRFDGLVLLDGGAGVQVPGSATTGSGLGLPSTWPGGRLPRPDALVW